MVDSSSAGNSAITRKNSSPALLRKAALTRNEQLPLSIIGGSDTATMSKSTGLPESVKLIFGAGGIYAAFLYYGSLQEDVFRFVGADGTSFKQAWFLQVLEAFASVIVGGLGLYVTGMTKNMPKKNVCDLGSISGQRKGIYFACVGQWIIISCR